MIQKVIRRYPENIELYRNKREELLESSPSQDGLPRGNLPANKMEQMCIRDRCEAMGRLRKNCSVIVITECSAVRSTLQNDWIRQWQASGWKNAKGKPVSHREAWEQLYGRMEGQEITVEAVSYTHLMQVKACMV